MEIKNTTDTSFGARFVSKAQILKKYPSSCYSKIDITVIELNPHNPQDVKTIKHLKQLWGGDSFAKDIYFCMEDIYNRSRSRKAPERFFAITTKQNNYNKLRGTSILAVAEIGQSGNNLILDYIQVNPHSAKNRALRHYRDVGKAFVQELSKIFQKSKVYISSAEEAMGFYEKLHLTKGKRKNEFILNA